MTSSEKNIAGVIAPPPLIYTGFLATGIAMEKIVFRTQGLDMPGSLQWTLVFGLILVALALIAVALIQFQRAGTRPEPWQPTTAFVATGVYKWTRNPMYLGMALAYFAIAIAADAPAALWFSIPLLITINYGVIAREEAYMAAKFGESYQDYISAVPRWL